MTDNGGQAFGCKHEWVYASAQIKEVLKHSDGNTGNPKYFNKLRYKVCKFCYTIKTDEKNEDLEKKV
jgi:hypothetical protein